MTESNVVALPPALPAEPLPRRKSSTDRAAAKLAKAQAQLREAKQRKQAALDHRAQIVGHCLIDAMGQDENLRRLVVDVLRRSVVKPTERSEIAILLEDRT